LARLFGINARGTVGAPARRHERDDPYESECRHRARDRCGKSVHRTLGPGLLESVYLACLLYELRTTGLSVETQYKVPIQYGDVQIECGYRIDVLVEATVILEVKAVAELAPIHEAQLLTYLRLSRRPVGLLINFNTKVLKHGVRRLINGWLPT